MAGRHCCAVLRCRPLGSPAASGWVGARAGHSVGRVPWSPVTCGTFLCPLSTIQPSVMLAWLPAAFTTARPPTHTGKGCGQGYPGGGGGSALQGGLVPKPLNGPIEALGRMTIGLLGPLDWSAEVRGLRLGRQCWLRGQTLTSRAGSQRL